VSRQEEDGRVQLRNIQFQDDVVVVPVNNNK